jgi:hypothetical protein
LTDEDEEEDEETKEEPEPEKGSTTEVDVKTGLPGVDKTADDLAGLLSKVSISGSRS